MFHYSVSGDNKSQVKSRLPGRGFSVRDIVVLSRSCKESISWRTSNWQPAWDFRLEKVIVRYVESMLSSLYSLCLTLSDWGDGLMFSKNNYKKTKRTLSKEGRDSWSQRCHVAHIHCDSQRETDGKNWYCSFITNRWNGTMVASCGVVRWHAVTMHCLAEGIQFSFRYVHVHHNWVISQRKQTNGKVINRQIKWQYAEHVNSNVRKTMSHSSAMIYSPICHMDAASILAFLLAS